MPKTLRKTASHKPGAHAAQPPVPAHVKAFAARVLANQRGIPVCIPCMPPPRPF